VLSFSTESIYLNHRMNDEKDRAEKGDMLPGGVKAAPDRPGIQ